MSTPESTIEERTAIRKSHEGERLAVLLNLREHRSYDPPRWDMGSFGSKTGIGVYEVIQRLAEETKKRVENYP